MKKALRKNAVPVKMDCSIKLFKHRTAGVREYWIVDLLKKTVVVYHFETDDYS